MAELAPTQELARRILFSGWASYLGPTSPLAQEPRNSFSEAKAGGQMIAIRTLATFIENPDPVIAAELMPRLGAGAQDASGAYERGIADAIRAVEALRK